MYRAWKAKQKHNSLNTEMKKKKQLEFEQKMQHYQRVKVLGEGGGGSGRLPGGGRRRVFAKDIKKKQVINEGFRKVINFGGDDESTKVVRARSMFAHASGAGSSGLSMPRFKNSHFW